jgi:hypothetical protein
MLKVLIEPAQAVPTAISNRSGTSSSGRLWQIRSQNCWIFKEGSSYPLLYSINLPENLPFYAAGDYLLDVESMIVPNDFGSLSLSRAPISLIFVDPDDSKKSDIAKKFGA